MALTPAPESVPVTCDLSSHRLGDQLADALGGIDEVPVGQVGVARRSAVTPVAEHLADLGQVIAGHDGVARYGVPQVVQAQPAEMRAFPDGMPARREVVGTPAFGQTCVDAPGDASIFLGRLGVCPASQCGKSRAAGPLGNARIGSISLTRVRRLRGYKLVFPIPSRLTVCPCLSSGLNS